MTDDIVQRLVVETTFGRGTYSCSDGATHHVLMPNTGHTYCGLNQAGMEQWNPVEDNDMPVCNECRDAWMEDTALLRDALREIAALREARDALPSPDGAAKLARMVADAHRDG